MRRRFNITGSCNPIRHYMVNLDDRVKRIKEEYVDEGSYFVINKGRQYGKTTTLKALEYCLKKDYIVIALDFQQIGTEDFASESAFVNSFTKKMCVTLQHAETQEKEILREILLDFRNQNINAGMRDLFECLSHLCGSASRAIVLMIDEVDSAGNNRLFIDFLAQLRSYYLNRDEMPIFRSVILAGVYDIKNLKLKLRPEAEHQYNSPWNIAPDFDIDMNFSAAQIVGMLEEYEADYHTGMDMRAMAEKIYDYTSGYPVLTSFICKYIDEKLFRDNEWKCQEAVWSQQGIEKAVKAILVEKASLFESMTGHLDEYPDMKRMFQAILFQGSEFSYSPDAKAISLACMFGYAVNHSGKVQIANRIFEMRLYNYFLAEEELSSAMGKMAQRDKGYFIHDGQLDMDMALRKFVDYFTEIYGDNDAQFIEDYGRKFFLLFLKPIINGTGNYYIEARTRDARRTDVIVDYAGEQFIIELKIWHGEEYNMRGERQLTDYLEYYHKDKGYMLSFNFNKKKEVGIKEIKIGTRTIVEAVV